MRRGQPPSPASFCISRENELIYVCSVPHTGSRSLLRKLQVGTWEAAVNNGQLLHFGYENDRINALGKIEVHIPIRNPIETIESWLRRNLPPKRCILRNMQSLVVYDNPKAIFHDIHQITDIREGATIGQKPMTLRRQATDAWDEYVTDEILDFYKQFYPYLVDARDKVSG